MLNTNIWVPSAQYWLVDDCGLERMPGMESISQKYTDIFKLKKKESTTQRLDVNYTSYKEFL